MKRAYLVLLLCSSATILTAGPGRMVAQGQQTSPFTGAWQPSSLRAQITLRIDGTKVAGSVGVPGDTQTPITGGTVTGNAIAFTVESPDAQRTVTFSGTLTGDSIAFNRTVATHAPGGGGGNGIFGAAGPASFTATRVGFGNPAPTTSQPTPPAPANRGRGANTPPANASNAGGRGASPAAIQALTDAVRGADGRQRSPEEIQALIQELGISPAAAAQAGVTVPTASPAPAGQALLRVINILDRSGAVVNRIDTPVPSVMMSISPDGGRVAYTQSDNSNVMVLDLASKASTRIATDGRSVPAWSPDGSRLAYVAQRNNISALYVKASNGTGDETMLVAPATGLFNWSVDGKSITYGGNNNFLYVPAGPTSGDRTPVVIFTTNGRNGPRMSPDNRFLAYLSSNETTNTEVWVRTLDPKDPTKAAGADGLTHWRISREGAAGMIRWRSDGKELYYIASDGGVMAASATANPQFKAGAPVRLFRVPAEFSLQATAAAQPGQQGDVSADGQRFLFLTPVSGTPDPAPVNGGNRGGARGARGARG